MFLVIFVSNIKTLPQPYGPKDAFRNDVRLGFYCLVLMNKTLHPYRNSQRRVSL